MHFHTNTYGEKFYTTIQGTPPGGICLKRHEGALFATLRATDGRRLLPVGLSTIAPAVEVFEEMEAFDALIEMQDDLHETMQDASGRY